MGAGAHASRTRRADQSSVLRCGEGVMGDDGGGDMCRTRGF